MSTAESSEPQITTVGPRAESSWGMHRLLTSPNVALANYALVAGLLALMLGRVLIDGLAEEQFGIHVSPEGELTMRDFAAHQTFVRAFWTSGAKYTPASHVSIASQWAGRPLEHGMPFGYSPTMLWLMGPLAALPNLWAFVAWSLLSGAAVWWMTRTGRAPPIAAALVLLSPLGFICFSLGQTALLTAAGMMYLMFRYAAMTVQPDNPQSAIRNPKSTGWLLWMDALVLWALTAKPPLALTAGAVLVAQKQWRTVGLALLLTVVSTLALTPQLGWDWPREYIHLLTHYDRETGDPALTWAMRPDHMSNLRSLFWHTGWLGDHAACRLVSILWLVSLGGLVVATWRRHMPAASAWCLAVLAYLLFCTQVTCTEDLQLILIVAAAGAGVFGVKDWKLPAIVIALCLFVALLPPGSALLGDAARSFAILGIKLFLGVLIFARLVAISRPRWLTTSQADERWA